MEVAITTKNIEEYRGALTIGPANLEVGVWDVFDNDKYNASTSARIVPMEQVVSTKNQLLDEKFLRGDKPDPRQNAFDLMLQAAKGKIPKRGPLNAVLLESGTYVVQDGNATVQALMLAGWKEVPVVLVPAVKS